MTTIRGQLAQDRGKERSLLYVMLQATSSAKPTPTLMEGACRTLVARSGYLKLPKVGAVDGKITFRNDPVKVIECG